MASVLCDNSVGDGQAQAGALSFCRKKRLKNSILFTVGDAEAAVVNGNHCEVVFSVYGEEADGAAGGCCVQGVECQIHKHLVELVRVSQHGDSHAGELEGDVAFLCFGLQEGDDAADDFVQAQGLFFNVAWAGKLHEAVEDALQAADFVFDEKQRLIEGSLFGVGEFLNAALQHGQLQGGAIEGVADFMGEAGCQRPDSSEFFCCLCAFGQLSFFLLGAYVARGGFDSRKQVLCGAGFHQIGPSP